MQLYGDDFNDNNRVGWTLLQGVDNFVENTQRLNWGSQITAFSHITKAIANDPATAIRIMRFKAASTGIGTNNRLAGWSFYSSSTKYFGIQPYSSGFPPGIWQAGYTYTVEQNTASYGTTIKDYTLKYDPSAKTIEFFQGAILKFKVKDITLDPYKPCLFIEPSGDGNENPQYWDDFSFEDRTPAYAPVKYQSFSEGIFYKNIYRISQGVQDSYFTYARVWLFEPITFGGHCGADMESTPSSAYYKQYNSGNLQTAETKNVIIPSGYTSAILYVRVNDGARIIVNGNILLDDNSPSSCKLISLVITNYIVFGGLNEFSIEVYANAPGGALPGWLYEAWVDLF